MTKRIKGLIIGHHGLTVDVIYDDNCKLKKGFTKDKILRNIKLPKDAATVETADYNITEVERIFNREIADIIKRHSWAVLKGRHNKVRFMIRLYKLFNKDRFLCYYMFKL